MHKACLFLTENSRISSFDFDSLFTAFCFRGDPDSNTFRGDPELLEITGFRTIHSGIFSPNYSSGKSFVVHSPEMCLCELFFCKPFS